MLIHKYNFTSDNQSSLDTARATARDHSGARGRSVAVHIHRGEHDDRSNREGCVEIDIIEEVEGDQTGNDDGKGRCEAL